MMMDDGNDYNYQVAINLLIVVLSFFCGVIIGMNFGKDL